MTKNNDRQTATIIPFPVRGANGLAKPAATAKPAPVHAGGAVCSVAGDSAWYHDAATHDGDPHRRH